MKKHLRKAGILIFLLVIPAFVFIFLKTFGDNKFALPYYFPDLDESGHVQVFEGDTLFHTVPDFLLVNQNGDSVALGNLENEIKVVNFFFSRCTSICPMMNRNLSRVDKSFSDIHNVHLMSISIDPDHDSISVLNDYAASFNARAGKWDFLTGDKAYIYNLAIKGFKLPVSDASIYDEEIIDVNDAFIHSEKVLLLDKLNFIRGIYDGTDVNELDKLRLEIKVLLENMEDQDGK